MTFEILTAAQIASAGASAVYPLAERADGKIIDQSGAVTAFSMSQGLMTVTGNTVALLGDSLSYDNCYSPDNTLISIPQVQQLTAGLTPGFNDYGPFVWANAKAGGRARLIRVDGVVGDTTAAIYARVGNVISAAPAVCILLPGKNDLLGILSTDTLATVLSIVGSAKTNTANTIAKLLTAGIRVILCTVQALGVGHPSRSAQMTLGENLLNSWIRDVSRSIPCVWLSDYAAAVNDPTLTISGVKSGYMRSDNLHYAAIGARAAGEQALYPALIAALPVATDILPRAVNQSYSVNVGERNRSPNPFLTGSGGSANPGTGTITGTIPANTALTNNGSPAVTSSIAARADGMGNYHQIVCIWSTAADQVKWEQYPSTSGIVVGQTIRAGCLISMSGASNLKGIDVYVFVTIGGVNYFFEACKMQSTTYDQTGFVDYMFLTPEIYVSAAVTSMVIGVRPYSNAATGGVTLQISRVLNDVI